jgi:M-phase inducer tyrosine phosphatase
MDMDLSPLPHKAPYVVELQLQSPTPDMTPVDMTPLIQMSVPSPPTSDPVVESPQLTLPVERKKGPLRPSLSRVKGLSTGNVPQQIHPEAQLPPFRFGNYPTNKPSSLSKDLSEIFETSSPLRDPRFAAPPIPLPRKMSNAGSTRNGSPIGQHARKASNPLVRPRKLFRRTLSMFEHPEDVMVKAANDSPPPLPSIVDMEAVHTPKLPHFHLDDSQIGELPRISRETMCQILDGQFDHLYEKRVVIDCRFEYEYSGGHINGAINFNDKEQLSTQLFDVEPTANALLIFHCEYSAHRAPLMAKFIRNKDRSVNAERYPALTYPEAYILDGGYSQFFKEHSIRCFPQSYVEMDAKEHEAACERGMGKVKQRNKLLRAQTFAFGQHSPGLDSSPTAMGRSRVEDDMDLSLDFTPAPASRPSIDLFRRGLQQRMSSY